jgi:hypothetical protein
MTAEDIPEDVRQLLRDHVTSFERLEVLLLLEAAPEQIFDIVTVCERVRMPEDIIGAALDALAAGQLIEKVPTAPHPTYRFAPGSPLRTAVHALTLSYDERRAAIMSIMSTNAIERLRSSTIRTFSDSFLLRKRKPDG